MSVEKRLQMIGIFVFFFRIQCIGVRYANITIRHRPTRSTFYRTLLCSEILNGG